MTASRRFGLLLTSIWQSEKFLSLTDPNDRLAYIWLHTSLKTSAGVLRVGPASLVDEVDFLNTLEEGLETLERLRAAGLIIWMKPFVIICKYVSANPPESWQHAVGALNEVLSLPKCTEKGEMLVRLRDTNGYRKLVKRGEKIGEPHKSVMRAHEYSAECDKYHSSDMASPRDDTHSITRFDPTDTLSKPLQNPFDGVSIEVKEKNKNRTSEEEKKEGPKLETLASSLGGGIELRRIKGSNINA